MLIHPEKLKYFQKLNKNIDRNNICSTHHNDVTRKEVDPSQSIHDLIYRYLHWRYPEGVDANRNRLLIRPFPLNLNRLRMYAIIEPVNTDPINTNTRIIIEFLNATPIFACFHACVKFSKYAQLSAALSLHLLTDTLPVS